MGPGDRVETGAGASTPPKWGIRRILKPRAAARPVGALERRGDQVALHRRCRLPSLGWPEHNALPPALDRVARRSPASKRPAGSEPP